MNERVSIKRILIDLMSIKEQVKSYFKEDDKYQVLIKYILEDERLNNEDMYLPTFKEMEKQTGIKIYHIRKQLKEIHDKMFDFENGHVFSFPKTEIWFNAKNNGKHLAFKCVHLSHIPRIGENMDLPFIKAKLGSDYFYVNDIRHWFSGETHTVDIYLKRGFFNSYWYHRLHEAKEKRELPFNDFYDLPEYELKNRLIK